MDQVTLTAITTLLSYWGGKSFDKVFDTATGEFTKGSISWLKSLFFKDRKPTEILKQFEEKPNSLARENAVKAVIELELEENPNSKKLLQELVLAIEAKSNINVKAINSKNIVVSDKMQAGGSIVVGDNNHL